MTYEARPALMVKTFFTPPCVITFDPDGFAICTAHRNNHESNLRKQIVKTFATPARASRRPACALRRSITPQRFGEIYGREPKMCMTRTPENLTVALFFVDAATRLKLLAFETPQL